MLETRDRIPKELLVEDDDLLRGSLKLFLKKDGLQVEGVPTVAPRRPIYGNRERMSS